MGLKLLMLFFAILVLFSVGCRPPYSMIPPDAFKRFEKSRSFKMITADGVMLRAREEENYPKASLDFWVDAMGQHLEKQGYALKSKRCFSSKKGKRGCTLDFLLPHGAEDWIFSETIFVEGETIVLVEVAGPFERYVEVEEALSKAMETFEPNLN